jgi:hypothetical protein
MVEKSKPKARIESLSDLIFGLALSIGALTLIGQPPSTFEAILTALGLYAFSFSYWSAPGGPIPQLLLPCPSRLKRSQASTSSPFCRVH